MLKSSAKLARQMLARDWTAEQIEEAIRHGDRVATVNRETNGAAWRYVHPETRRSVVIDEASDEVIHVGGDGFRY